MGNAVRRPMNRPQTMNCTMCTCLFDEESLRSFMNLQKKMKEHEVHNIKFIYSPERYRPGHLGRRRSEGAQVWLEISESWREFVSSPGKLPNCFLDNAKLTGPNLEQSRVSTQKFLMESCCPLLRPGSHSNGLKSEDHWKAFRKHLEFQNFKF